MLSELSHTIRASDVCLICVSWAGVKTPGFSYHNLRSPEREQSSGKTRNAKAPGGWLKYSSRSVSPAMRRKWVQLGYHLKMDSNVTVSHSKNKDQEICTDITRGSSSDGPAQATSRSTARHTATYRVTWWQVRLHLPVPVP